MLHYKLQQCKMIERVDLSLKMHCAIKTYKHPSFETFTGVDVLCQRNKNATNTYYIYLYVNIHNVVAYGL